MRYIVRHHSGTLWFQIRVPVALTPRFGPIIRQCLGTGDLSEARSLALQLAGDWLSRFSAARQGIELPQVAQASTADDPADCSRAQEYKSVYIGAPAAALTANPPIVVAQTQDAAPAHPKTRADDFAKLFAAWKRANPDRALSTVIEVKRVLHLFERFVRKHPSDVQRADIAAWRDRLIASSQARASVAKKIGFISTILQVGYDAGHLTQNVARGLKIPKATTSMHRRRPQQRTTTNRCNNEETAGYCYRQMNLYEHRREGLNPLRIRHFGVFPGKQKRVVGLERAHWSGAARIRTIFRDAFTSAGLPYFNPHSFRNTLVRLGQAVCQTPEDFKAWSQNLGHDKVLTTFLSYGHVLSPRQGEIIRGLATPQVAMQPDVSELAKALVREMRESGVETVVK